MNNNLKTKTKKKNSLKSASFTLLDRTLHENTGPILCFSVYIKALHPFSYKNLSLFKAKLKKHFWPSFPENKIHSSTHHTHIRFKLYSDAPSHVTIEHVTEYVIRVFQ